MSVGVGGMSLFYRVVSTKKAVGNTRDEGICFFPGPNNERETEEKSSSAPGKTDTRFYTTKYCVRLSSAWLAFLLFGALNSMHRSARNTLSGGSCYRPGKGNEKIGKKKERREHTNEVCSRFALGNHSDIS
jgi:hypothetical protein